jgi:hypothetical protein
MKDSRGQMVEGSSGKLKIKLESLNPRILEPFEKV